MRPLRLSSAFLDSDMSMQQLLAKLREEAFEHGEFHLGARESIDEVVIREQVSQGWGIYIISGCRDTKRVVLYIGRAGTVTGDAVAVNGPGLQQHFRSKQGGISRRLFFQQLIEKMNLDTLHIEWLVTYEQGQGILPTEAEAALLNAFMEASGLLPALNG